MSDDRQPAPGSSNYGGSQYGASHYGGGANTTAYNKPKFTRTGTRVDMNDGEKAHPPAAPEVEQEEIERARGEQYTFCILLFLHEVMMIILMGIWFTYTKGDDAIAEGKELYGYERDVFVMVIFGFGFLMTFLRRCGFSSVAFTFLITGVTTQWSLLCGAWFLSIREEHGFSEPFQIGIEDLLNALFCAAACLISYGAIIGKTTPTQLVFLMFLEPIFYWLNIFIVIEVLEVFDIGGGLTIHTFGAFYGLAMCWFFSSKKYHGHSDNTSAYLSDLTSLAGTAFLFIMWPSFNAALATGRGHIMALVNNFVSLMGSTLATFLVSRLFPDGKIEIVCVQNSVLAGGVAMGAASHLNITIGGATAIGFVAGAVSCWGFRKLLPFLGKKMHIQDVCGIVNLHCLPGIISGLVAIVAAGALCDSHVFPHGCTQAGYQTAGLFISIGIGIGGGIINGAICNYALSKLNHLAIYQLFNDQPFFHSPTDYSMTV